VYCLSDKWRESWRCRCLVIPKHLLEQRWMSRCHMLSGLCDGQLVSQSNQWQLESLECPVNSAIILVVFQAVVCKTWTTVDIIVCDGWLTLYRCLSNGAVKPRVYGCLLTVDLYLLIIVSICPSVCPISASLSDSLWTRHYSVWWLVDTVSVFVKWRRKATCVRLLTDSRPIFVNNCIYLSVSLSYFCQSLWQSVD